MFTVISYPSRPVPCCGRSPSRSSLTPYRIIPAYEEADGFRLTEAHAILPYVADQQGWDDLYPKDIKKRAKVNQWLHWHHTNVRPCTLYYFRPQLMQMQGFGSGLTPEKAKKGQKLMKDTFAVMKYGALNKTSFLAGDSYTLADICLYCELDQLEALGTFDFAPYPEVVQWMGRMKALPEHDTIRKSLIKLGDMVKSAQAKL